MIDLQEFSHVFVDCHDPDEWVSAINGNLGLNGITSPIQHRLFLCQTGAETMGFTSFVENLNYSASGLVKTFPRYFSAQTAKLYAKNPQKIANRVYASRNGNGPESSNDGWNYRGRGLIQLTGRENYHNAALALNVPSLMSTPDILITDKKLSAQAAVWFWVTRNLTSMSTVEQTTRAINGGLTGLSDRQYWYRKLENISSE